MPLSSKIVAENGQDEDEDDVPEEIEHDLIKDSVLEMTGSNFKIDDDFDEPPMGDIRKNVVEDLGDEYKGKPVSRDSYSKRNWMDDRGPSDEDGSISDDQGTVSDGSASKDGDSEKNSDDEDIQESDDEGMEEEESQQSDNDEEESDGHEESDGINIFSSGVKDISRDLAKGNSIKNQLVLWEKLMECRIKLQKGLAASNRFIQKDSFNKLKSVLSPGLERQTLDNTVQSLTRLLENLINLQVVLLKKCPEYKSFKKGNTEEEVTSSESEEDSGPASKKRRSLEEYGSDLCDSTRDYTPFRNAVIQKWNDKTRLASGNVGISKFAILEQSTLKQIEQSLLDRDRLLKRTRTRRSKLPVLGKTDKTEDPSTETPYPLEDEHKTNSREELDCEIFDDDDFYHKLLRDLIDRKTSDITDPAQLARRWSKLQKLRSKMKRKVDTRATKGRKIRYTVHNKLVNFMAPVSNRKWDDRVENDLFSSLFGKASVPQRSAPQPEL